MATEIDWSLPLETIADARKCYEEGMKIADPHNPTRKRIGIEVVRAVDRLLPSLSGADMEAAAELKRDVGEHIFGIKRDEVRI